jgi:purine nucleosidase
MLRISNLIIFILLGLSTFAQKQKVWLDADTGNEMDDVWAIYRLLWAKDQVDIKGLSSAHFNTPDLVVFDKWNQYPTAGINTVRLSQKINEEILASIGMENIPHPMGADRQIGRAWGELHPRPSEASKLMLKTIKELKENEKLDILFLGNGANIATLLLLNPEVKSKIRLFSMGFRYNSESQLWNKNEFNIRCDLNAADFLLNQEGLDWTFIPVETCLPYRFDKTESYQKLQDQYPAEYYMQNRWETTNPENNNRILWDMALVQLYLNPGLGTVTEIMTPPENHQHKVKVYSKANYEGLYADFWNTVQKNRNTYQAPSTKAKLGQLHFGNRVGGTFGQEAETKQYLFANNNTIVKSVQVGLTPTLGVVQCIQIEVETNGKPEVITMGSTENAVFQKKHLLKINQKLVGIKGASGWFIDRLAFVFSDGTTTPMYGGNGGDNEFSLVLAKDTKGKYKGELTGFYGSATNQLESIGLVFWPNQ